MKFRSSFIHNKTWQRISCNLIKLRIFSYSKLIGILLFYVFALSPVYANTSLHFKISGINGDVLQNVESRLNILQNSFGDTISTEQIRTIYQQAPQEIHKGLEPYGYFKPSIHSELIRHDSTFTATFHITPGPLLHIGKVNVMVDGPGKDNEKIKKYLTKFPIQVGDVFQATAYENAKDKLFQKANEQGYLKAFLEDAKVLIDLNAYKASIILHFNTGPRYYFGPVRFEETSYHPKFLHRFIPFTENEPFSSQKLINFQQELANSYYFQQVVVTPDFAHIENNRVPINIGMIVPKAKRYSIGVGYGSFTGPRLTAGMSWRRVNNVGHHFDAQLKLSSVLSGLAAKYYIPGYNPLTDQWIIGANYQRFLPKNGSSSSEMLSSGYIKKIDDYQISANLNYLFERYSVIMQPKRVSKLLYPSLNFTYIKSDNPINPRFGKSFNLTLQGASEGILSTTSFMQALVKGKYMYSPYKTGSIILRGEFGYTAVHNLNDLPLSMRFFAGGINSIRGFPDSSIGPGRYLKVGSVEFQQDIIWNWKGAIFYDVGTAADHWNTRLNRGAGVGIIYSSMIGPIKLYVAKALNKRTQPYDKRTKPYDIEFSIGPEF